MTVNKERNATEHSMENSAFLDGPPGNWMSDAALYNHAGAFRRTIEIQPHEDGTVQGLCYRENGKPYIRLFLEGVESAELKIRRKRFPMQEVKPGCYETEELPEPGIYHITVFLNGIETISPYFPIYTLDNKPANYVEIGPLPSYLQCRNVPHGDVRHEIYYSEVMQRMEAALVYTPPYYDKSGEDYPVLYLQHGNGENERSWVWNGKINFLMDNLIAEGKAVPMLIVMANGMVILEKGRGAWAEVKGTGESDGDSHGTGTYSLQKAMFERQILEDIIPFIEKKYRTKKDRDHRAMAGLSMGSKQTSITVMKHLDQFAWAGLFSGFMDDFLDDYHNDHLRQLLQEKERFNQEMHLFFRSIGTEDEGFHYFQENDRFCEEHGIRTYRKLYQGGHNWNVWRQCSCDFLQMVFQERFYNYTE